MASFEGPDVKKSRMPTSYSCTKLTHRVFNTTICAKYPYRQLLAKRAHHLVKESIKPLDWPNYGYLMRFSLPNVVDISPIKDSLSLTFQMSGTKEVLNGPVSKSYS